jgi:hypothetical protein
MAKKKRYADSNMRGRDWGAYTSNQSNMGTKRDVVGSDDGRYDEGMLDGRGQFANLPQNVVQRAWPDSPRGEMEAYPNGLMAADRQMKRDKKGIHKVGLPNRG